jgi:hypothetical protein
MYNVHYVLIIFSFFGTLQAATVGSDTAPTRFNTQQALDNNDRVAGFAALAGGFALQGFNVNAQWDTFFPVSGLVQLNGGTLILTRDLVFRNNSVFGGGLGNIIGNGHAIEFSTSITVIPLLDADLISCGLLLTYTQAENSDVEVIGWSFDDKFLTVGKDPRVPVDTIENYEMVNQVPVLRQSFDPPGAATEVNAIEWHPTNYLVGITRQLSADSEVFTYTCNPSTGILTLVSSAAIAGNVAAAVWHPSGSFFVVGTNVAAAEISVYPVNAAGVLGAPTTFNLAGSRVIQNEAMTISPDGNYLAVGLATNGVNPEMLVFRFTTSPITLTQVASRFFGVNVNAVDWNPTFTQYIANGLAGTSGDLAQVQEFRTTSTALTPRAFALGIGGDVSTIGWRPTDGKCLVVTRGILGITSFLRSYAFDASSTSTLRRITEFTEIDDLDGMAWNHAGTFVAVGRDGTVTPDIGALLLFQNPLNFILTTCFEWNTVKIFFDCDVTIRNACIKFTGQSLINGRGNVLTIDSTTTLLVGPNSSLMFKDIIIKGVSDHQLGAVDGTSTYSFQDATMVLDGNYSFTVGKFDVIKDLEVSGNGFVFAYRTDQVSTISSTGRLILDEGVTFSYDPRSSSRNLLRFSDASAELVLNSATLYATTTGINLTKGYMVVDGSSFLAAEGSTAATGITFGDNATAVNNFCIELMPAASLNILRGLVSYANV